MMSSTRGVKWKHASSILLPILLFLLLLCTHSQSTVVKTDDLQVCEGDTARLECTGDSEQISIELANFGRFTLSLCNVPYNPEYSTNCLNNETILILANKCNGKSSCEFVAGPTLFGDTCPGTSKYLDVKFSCIHVTTTVAPSTQTSHDNGAHLVAPTDQSLTNVKYFIDNKNQVSNENCPTVFYRLIQWPETHANQLANVACPLGSHGRAQRMCLSSGQWSVETDLSECVSSTFQNLQNDFKQTWNSDFMVLVDLVEDLQQFIRTEKLLGGDLIQLSHLLHQINHHNSKFANVYNRLQLSETSKLTVRILNEVLQIGQREAWLDLLADKQTEVAHRFLVSVQRSLQNVAHGLTSTQLISDMFVARPAVLGVAAISRTQNTMELPASSSYDIEDRVLFSLSDTELNREYELVYSSIADLGQFLMRKTSKSTCNRVLMSKVLSTWSQTRSLDPKDEKLPLVLSFSTRKPDPSLRVQCTKWSESQSEFVEDGSCMILVHNSTQTICRCMGTGHYAVIASTCDAQLFIGLNKETAALYASCILAIFGLCVYLFGLSLIKQNQPKYVFIRRNFCATLLVAEFLLCVWFLMPRHGLWSSLLLYFLHGAIFTVAFWILIQAFQLFYSLVHNQRNFGARFLHYVIGYTIPLIFTITLILTSGNFGLFLQGFQPLQRPVDLFITGPLVMLMFVHMIFAGMAVYLLAKRFGLGYTLCRSDADNVLAIRNSLIHLAPLIVAIDVFCFVVIQFSLHCITIWLWLVVVANIVQALLTLRVLNLKRLLTGKLFCEKKQMRAADLPKNAIFSPAVQSGSSPGFNFSYNDQAYMKNQGLSLGSFGDQPMYVPSNAVHMPHECNCEYASIPPDYYSFYNNQHYRVYQQHPTNPSQLQQRPPVPQIPIGGFCRLNEQHPMMFNQQDIVDETAHSPVCHEHGSRCPSLAALRMSQTQLYHQQQTHRPSSLDGGSYETARSTSTSGGTTSSVASSGTFLLRMDLKQNPPIFLDES